MESFYKDIIDSKIQNTKEGIVKFFKNVDSKISEVEATCRHASFNTLGAYSYEQILTQQIREVTLIYPDIENRNYETNIAAVGPKMAVMNRKLKTKKIVKKYLLSKLEELIQNENT